MTTNIHRHGGLSPQEVEESRAKHGKNTLTPPPRPSVWKLYVEKFQDPVIRILLVAAFLSLLIAFWEQEFAETIGIFCAIFLATGIGFYFEYDALRRFEQLNTVADDVLVLVRRNGVVQEIPKQEIVVGDIVLLNTGDEVPADGTLIEAVSLQMNESSLTGELSVSKTTDPAHFNHEHTYPSNHVLRGTTVINGHAVYKVEKVGDATEIGKVARQSTIETGEDTPLNKQLHRLAQLLGRIGFIVAGLMFVIFTVEDLYGYFQTHPLPADLIGWLPVLQVVLKYFMMAVTLIVVAVPEGLPMSITLSLALNMRRMLKTNNLIRKMHAGETMGAITVICTDKTGTLTQNKMQVYETRLENVDERVLHEAIATNSTAFLEEKEGTSTPSPVGNPTEGALLLWLRDKGVDYLREREGADVIDQLAFSTEHKYMATIVQSAVLNAPVLYMKGAPEIVMRYCRLTDEAIAAYQQRLQVYQQKAMRTLAVAYRAVQSPATTVQAEIEKGEMTLLGVFAISDPVRDDVPAAIGYCHDAGIAVKVITGDTAGTAKEIARQIGLWTATDGELQHITGAEFEALSDEEALKRAQVLKVMSRARPLDKQRLVQLLQKAGAVVAVTGDGTNDAPALNHAHVGLSMGTGTSVAKDASDITLLDDSFKSIVSAVMWGRSLYKNIQRFILFQLTINLVALASVLLAAVFGTTLPLTVTQMLWVNLIMDTFAALALASISPDLSVMQEPPRRAESFIITPSMGRSILGSGILFLAGLIGLLAYFTYLHIIPTLHDLTIFFTVFVLLQFWNLFNVATFGTHHSVFTYLRQIKGTVGVALLILVGQWLIVSFGGKLFRVEPLAWGEWGMILLCTSSVFWLGEAWRAFRRWTAP